MQKKCPFCTVSSMANIYTQWKKKVQVHFVRWVAWPLIYTYTQWKKLCVRWVAWSYKYIYQSLQSRLHQSQTAVHAFVRFSTQITKFVSSLGSWPPNLTKVHVRFCEVQYSNNKIICLLYIYDNAVQTEPHKISFKVCELWCSTA